MGISFSAPASRGHNDALAGRLQIANQLSGRCIPDDRAHRHLDHAIVAAPAIAILAHALLAAASPISFREAKIERRGKLMISSPHHVPPMAAIAAIGAASRNELLPPETHATTPAITGDDADFYFIDELHWTTGVVIITFLRAKKKPRKGLSCIAKMLYPGKTLTHFLSLSSRS